MVILSGFLIHLLMGAIKHQPIVLGLSGEELPCIWMFPTTRLEKSIVRGLYTTVGKVDFLPKLRTIAIVALMKLSGKTIGIKLRFITLLVVLIGLLH